MVKSKGTPLLLSAVRIFLEEEETKRNKQHESTNYNVTTLKSLKIKIIFETKELIYSSTCVVVYILP